MESVPPRGSGWVLSLFGDWVELRTQPLPQGGTDCIQVCLYSVGMERELTLLIILEKPPAGVDYALQEGGGNNYKTVQTQRSTGRDLKFNFSVRVQEGKDGQPNFLGSFVQGPTGERFVYLDIGTCAGQTNTQWSRRLKIPLRGISWEMIDKKKSLQTRVPGTAKDGSPTCATVKPFGGWVSQ